MAFAPEDVDLSMLLSFPRSGSNFLQNVIKSNCKTIHCTSAYANGVFLRAQSLLKSHAVDEALLLAELRGTWNRHAPRSGTIVLTRDPRDLMISYYDFLQTVFAGEITPETLFEYDFNWIKDEWRSRKKTDIVNKYEDRIDPPSEVFTVLDAYKGWHQSWIAPAPDPNWLRVRYEDLIQHPQDSFNAIFDYLNLPKPDTFAGLTTFVSLHGDSARTRGKAQGWRTAPDMYRPILDKTSDGLAGQIADMGYA